MLDIAEKVFETKSEVVEIVTNPGMGVFHSLRNYAKAHGMKFLDVQLEMFMGQVTNPEEILNLTDEPTIIAISANAAGVFPKSLTYSLVSLSSPTCKIVKVIYQ